MKKKATKGKWLWIVLVVALLFPCFIGGEGDGGTTFIGNLLYEVTFYHYFAGTDLDGRYWVYTSVSIFGHEIYESPRRIVQE